MVDRQDCVWPGRRWWAWAPPPNPARWHGPHKAAYKAIHLLETKTKGSPPPKTHLLRGSHICLSPKPFSLEPSQINSHLTLPCRWSPLSPFGSLTPDGRWLPSRLAWPLWGGESGKGSWSCLVGMEAAAGPRCLRLAYSAFLGETFLFNVSRANASIAKSEKITCWCVNQDVTNNPVCLIIASRVLWARKGGGGAADGGAGSGCHCLALGACWGDPEKVRAPGATWVNGHIWCMSQAQLSG